MIWREMFEVFLLAQNTLRSSVGELKNVPHTAEAKAVVWDARGLLAGEGTDCSAH